MFDAVAFVAQTGQTALQSQTAEQALAAIMQACHANLGNRQTHLEAGALDPGQQQFFVAGSFLITPDRQYQMLVGNTGFPPEQKRLMVPINGGHPGWVVANRKPLLLANTDDHGSFKQYLKTSRMGSAIYAPLCWGNEVIGLIILAAKARQTLRQSDLDILSALAPVASACWIALGGPQWLASTYPPADAWRAPADGLRGG